MRRISGEGFRGAESGAPGYDEPFYGEGDYPPEYEKIVQEPPAQPEKKKYKIAYVEAQGAVDARAKDVARDEMTEEKGKAGFFKRIWKHNWLKDYYERKKENEARERIQSSGNLYVHKDGASKVAHDRAMGDITERFISEHETEMVHRAAGEDKKSLEKALGSAEAATAVKSVVKEIVLEYVRGNISTKEEFEQLHNQRLRHIAGLPEQMLRQGVEYASNVYEVARQIKASVRHQEALKDLDFDLDISIGEAKAGVRTEAERERIDKIVDTLNAARKRSRIASALINETTLGLAVTGVYSVVKKLGIGALRSKAAAWLSFGAGAAVGGAVAAAQENKRIKVERAQHARESAVSASLTGERRAELETSNYEMAEARTLMSELAQRRSELEDAPSIERYNNMTSVLAEINARINLSDQRSIDLIRYSDLTQVESERKELDLARAEARVFLRNFAADPNNRITLPAGGFENYFTGFEAMRARNILQGDITQKDAIFREMKYKRVRNAFLKTAAMSIAIGTVGQQLFAWGKDLTGFGQGRNDTLLEHGYHTVKSWIKGSGDYSQAGSLLENHIDLHDGLDHSAKIPQGWKIEPVNGHYNLVDGSGKTLFSGLDFDSSGKLDQHSIDMLKAQGFGYAENMVSVDNKTNATDYFSKYLDHHKRVDWHDEPGKRYSEFFKKAIEFEGKQQMLYIKEDANGVYVDAHRVLENLSKNAQGLLDKFGRNPDGSFDSKLQHLVNQLKTWQLNGTLGEHLRIAIIPTVDANRQGLSMLLDGAPDGKIRFPDEITQLFKQGGPQSLRDGHMPFKFGELFIDAPEGRHVLSTVKGHDALGEILQKKDIFQPEITPPGGIPDYDVPFAIPVHDRKPLEKAKYGTKASIVPKAAAPEIEPEPGADYDANEYGVEYRNAFGYMDNIGRFQRAEGADNGLSRKDEERRILARLSPRLKENPRAILDAMKEGKGYFARMNPEELKVVEHFARVQGVMTKDCKISVGIPVAGHQEGDNIYRTLNAYTHQDMDPKNFELVLFVNHPEKEKDTGKKLTATKTLSEIDRFRKDHPNFNVKVIYQMFPGENVNIGTVRKIINDSILYRHLQRGEGVQDHIIVSNDADLVGVSPEYLSNFVNKFEKNRNVDAYLGQLDWDPEANVENPVLYVGTRLYEFLRTQSRRSNPKHFGTSGANFAFRASIYAGVGGYDGALTKGEDMNLGRAIRMARGAFNEKFKGQLPIDYAGARVSRVYTSSRRALYAWEQHGRPVNNMWNGEFSAQDEARLLKLRGERVDYNNPAFLEDLKKGIEIMINRTMDVKLAYSKRLKKDEPKYRRMIERLGIRYELDKNGDVVIVDMSSLIDKLKRYQESGVIQRDAKSGVPGAKEKLKGVLKDQEKAIEKRAKERQKEYERKTQKLKKTIERFLKNDKLEFTHKNPLLSADVVRNSTDQRKIGEYTYANDKPLKKHEQAGGVYPGIDKNGNVVVIKVVPKKFMEQAATDYGSQDGKYDVEKYLDEKGYKDGHVLTPEFRAEEGNFVFRVYEAGQESLAELLRRGEKLSPKQAISIMLRVGEGIRSLHENGIGHSDVAHLNIILTQNDAKIGDLESGSIDKTGSGRFGRRESRGSPFISPPEMFSSTPLTVEEYGRATPRYDYSTDVYESAAVLYRMLTGEYPKPFKDAYDIKNVAERRVQARKVHENTKVKFPGGFPDPLKSVIRKALEPVPQRRYRTMADFELALLRAYEQV